MKPNLFIVGAPKCGTTAWYEYLNSHPDIFFSEVKEPTHFAPDFPGMHWAKSRKDYEKLFRRAGNAKILGDASACHLFSEVAAAGIARYNPDARILIFLRPQEDFIPSFHHHLLMRFEEQIEDLEEAWKLSGNRPPNSIPKTSTEPGLLNYEKMGRYSEHVKRYLDVFPAQQVKVIHFAEWAPDPRRAYLEILDFLDLEDDGRTEFPQVNEARVYPVKYLRKLITHPPRFLELGVSALRKILGRDALGLGTRASKLISIKGYKTSIPPNLTKKLRAYYAQDNRRLARMLDTASSSTG